MKTVALQAFRRKLARNEPVYGLWVTLESASITEMAVALGLDWVVIDIEHGHLDWKDVLEHVRATVRSDTVILARIVGIDQGIIKRVLDIGADGIVIPWVESTDQLRQALAYAHYPPEGKRGIGGERATCWGQCLPQHVAEANENVLVIPIIESVRGGRQLPQMLQVEGIDVFFFGPSDYSSSAGFAGQWEGPGVADEILAMARRVRQAGKHCGVIATGDANLNERLNQGFRMLAVGLDGGLLIRSLRRALSAVGRDAGMASSLHAGDAPTSPAKSGGYGGDGEAATGARPATHGAPAALNDLFEHGATFRPMTLPGTGSPMIQGGLTLRPGVNLPYRAFDSGISLMLLRGKAIVDVEGRMHTLEPHDAIVIPPSLAVRVTNRSPHETCDFLASLHSVQPASHRVETFFPRKAIASGTSSAAYPERVFRWNDH